MQDTRISGTEGRPQRHLPWSIVAVMWVLGLIDWSHDKTSGDESSDADDPPPLIIVNSNLKRKLLCVTSRINLLILMAFHWYCGYNYINIRFGRAIYFYHLATFLLSFWPVLVYVQVLCLFTTLYRWWRRGNCETADIQWWTVLSESSVMARFRLLRFPEFKPPRCTYFVLFCLMIITNNALDLAYYFVRREETKDSRTPYSLTVEFWMIIGGMWFFAIFCYFMHLQRLALELNFDHALWFVKRNAGDIAICQNKLSGCFKDYIRMRSMIRPWIQMSISASAFGLAAQLAWIYKVIGEEEADRYLPALPFSAMNITHLNVTSSQKIEFGFVNALIVINKLTLLVLAVLAVGGTDIDGIWKRWSFIMHVMCSSKHQRFWTRFTSHLQRINAGNVSYKVVDILLPILLVAIGMLSVAEFDF